MNKLQRSALSASEVAWSALQTLSAMLPNRNLRTPAWAQGPLLTKDQRWKPSLGPRKTTSVCPTCVLQTRDSILRGKESTEALTHELGTIEAEIVEEAGKVLLRKSCPQHGPFEDTLASDAQFFWRMESLYSGADYEKGSATAGLHSVTHGRGSFVIIDVTTRCNMKCGTCFMDANQVGHVFEPTFAEIKAQLDHAASIRPKREFNILFSGGEPTLSTELLPAIAYARSIGFSRLHIATNGITLAENPDFANDLRKAGLHAVYLQCDGMTEESNAHRHIANYLEIKKRAIENINAAGMSVTLQVTVARGVNNDGVGQIVKFAAANIDKIFGVVFQPIMFTGRDEQIDDERRYRTRYTASDLASDLMGQTDVDWRPMRDWFPMSSYGIFSTYVDMLHLQNERGSTFVSGHPDAQIFSPLLVNSKTGEWLPVGACFNVSRFLTDIETIIQNGRGNLLTKAQMASALLRNFIPNKMPDLGLRDVFSLLRQCELRVNSQVPDWSSSLNRSETWRLLFVGSSTFQDLFNYELPNLQLSTALVSDWDGQGENQEVSFSFKNAGGWRQISERLRKAPSLAEWHTSRGRHAIYTNHQIVPVENLTAQQEAFPSNSDKATHGVLV